MNTLVKQPLSLGAPKRVGLIIPPSAFLLDERVFVSLGVLKIASALEGHGHLVHVLDLSGIKNYIEALSVYIDSCHDDVIGITSTTPRSSGRRAARAGDGLSGYLPNLSGDREHGRR